MAVFFSTFVSTLGIPANRLTLVLPNKYVYHFYRVKQNTRRKQIASFSSLADGGGLGDFAEFRIGKEEHRGKETEKQAADLKRSSSADTLCDCPKRGKLGGLG